jgi:glycosyltransferase involved in cell wall biosynthesis
MKVLLVHNHYLQPGGEDRVFAAETAILRAHGHDVRVFTAHNERVATMGRLELARSTVWNQSMLEALTALMQEFVPDIVHCHNTFPLISPAAYEAARRCRIPVVQTLHNFRLLCVNGLFLRSGHRCEDCLGRRVAWPGVLHACYRESRPASAVVAAMLALHRWRGTWREAVDTYVVMSEFARAKFVAGGLPANRIVVKPNCLDEDPGIGAHTGRFALYVGRLSPEKGIGPLVELWGRLAPGLTLRIIGTGPLESLAASKPPEVEWLGYRSRQEVLEAMKAASFLVFPTECYEGLPMVLLEAMATGLPVIASRQGALPEILSEGADGMLVASNDPHEWQAALTWAIEHPEAMAAMGARARQSFERRYAPDIGYRKLSDVYRQILARRGQPRDRGSLAPGGLGPPAGHGPES